MKDGADDDGLPAAEHAVGEHAAEERREVDEAGVEAVDLRRQRLRRQHAEGGLERVPEGVEAEHLGADVGPDEQVVDHVQHEQRAHAVVAHPLPGLGQEQDHQALRMAEPVAFGGRASSGGEGGDGGSRMRLGAALLPGQWRRALAALAFDITMKQHLDQPLSLIRVVAPC